MMSLVYVEICAPAQIHITNDLRTHRATCSTLSVSSSVGRIHHAHDEELVARTSYHGHTHGTANWTVFRRISPISMFSTKIPNEATTKWKKKKAQMSRTPPKTASLYLLFTFFYSDPVMRYLFQISGAILFSTKREHHPKKYNRKLKKCRDRQARDSSNTKKKKVVSALKFE